MPRPDKRRDMIAGKICACAMLPLVGLNCNSTGVGDPGFRCVGHWSFVDGDKILTPARSGFVTSPVSPTVVAAPVDCGRPVNIDAGTWAQGARPRHWIHHADGKRAACRDAQLRGLADRRSARGLGLLSRPWMALGLAASFSHGAQHDPQVITVIFRE